MINNRQHFLTMTYAFTKPESIGCFDANSTGGRFQISHAWHHVASRANIHASVKRNYPIMLKLLPLEINSSMKFYYAKFPSTAASLS